MINPYSLIKVIRYKDGHYKAFDKNDNFVMELSVEGAMELVRNHGVRKENFSIDFLRGLLNFGNLTGLGSSFGLEEIKEIINSFEEDRKKSLRESGE